MTEPHKEAALRESRRLCRSPLQMLKVDMLEVEVGSNQATKNNWKVKEVEGTQKALSDTLHALL